MEQDLTEEDRAIETRYQERQALLEYSQQCLDDCEMMCDALEGFFQDPEYRLPSEKLDMRRLNEHES